MPQIKAIPTKYRGYEFRSRLEARYAIFLDDMEESWEYELEGFQLPSGWYLPDFFLTDMDCWLEIKGQQPSEQELIKCEELFRMTEKPVILTVGIPQTLEDPNFDDMAFCGVTSSLTKIYFWCCLCTDFGAGDWKYENCMFGIRRQIELAKTGKLVLAIDDLEDDSRIIVNANYKELDWVIPLNSWSKEYCALTDDFTAKMKSCKFNSKR